MISFASIWAVVLRLLYVWFRDFNLLLGTFYWPLLDVFIWGFLGRWIQQAQMATFHNYETVALMGILLWQIVGRGGCNILATTLNEELWSRNIAHLFSLPVRTFEWMCGIVLFYGIMITIISIFCMGFIFLLYHVSVWEVLATFLIFFPPLFVSGIWLGFICLSIIITLGKRGAELGYVVGWFLLPLSGAYYPLEVLPAWAQKISMFLPMSYVFNGMRAYLMRQQDPTPYLVKGYVLSVLYAACSILLFVYCFRRSKRNGLARLVD